jgi:hypothetical protein
MAAAPIYPCHKKGHCHLHCLPPGDLRHITKSDKHMYGHIFIIALQAKQCRFGNTYNPTNLTCTYSPSICDTVALVFSDKDCLKIWYLVVKMYSEYHDHVRFCGSCKLDGYQ